MKGSYISVEATINILNVTNASLCGSEESYHTACISSGNLNWLRGKVKKKGKSPYS